MAKVITKKVDKRIGVECTLQEFLEAAGDDEVKINLPTGNFRAVLGCDAYELYQGTVKLDTTKIKMKIFPEEDQIEQSFVEAD